MKKETSNKNASKDISFEAALTRLEEIVSKLESGDLPLDESLRLFEDGAALSIICSRKLEETEQKILKISAGSVSAENSSEKTE